MPATAPATEAGEDFEETLRQWVSVDWEASLAVGCDIGDSFKVYSAVKEDL